MFFKVCEKGKKFNLAFSFDSYYYLDFGSFQDICEK
jgi:hypothetical protein